MVVLTGVKAAFELTQHAIPIKQQGIDFAIRYYSHHAGKNLSLAEARALTDAGIQIGVVWETIGAHLHSFSRAQGLADGAAAYLMAQSAITQPSGSAIYFEVDCHHRRGYRRPDHALFRRRQSSVQCGAAGRAALSDRHLRVRRQLPGHRRQRLGVV